MFALAGHPQWNTQGGYQSRVEIKIALIAVHANICQLSIYTCNIFTYYIHALFYLYMAYLCWLKSSSLRQYWGDNYHRVPLFSRRWKVRQTHRPPSSRKRLHESQSDQWKRGCFEAGSKPWMFPGEVDMLYYYMFQIDSPQVQFSWDHAVCPWHTGVCHNPLKQP